MKFPGIIYGSGNLFSRVRARYRLFLYPYVTLLAVCVRFPRRSVIYYILLAAISAVSVCVLSSPWWSGLAEPWPSTVYIRLVKINYVYKVFFCIRTLYKTLPKWLRHVNHMWYELNELFFFKNNFGETTPTASIYACLRNNAYAHVWLCKCVQSGDAKPWMIQNYKFNMSV